MAVFAFGEAFPQTIQLGSGTTESSNYDSSPVNIYYRRTVCQFIFTAAELQAEGASTTAPISEFGFYVTESPLYSIPNYRIRMKHTAQADVSTPLNNAGWTNVKTSFTYTPTAGGYDMIVLDGSTFTWDGVSNIAVEICWSRVNPTWSASGKVRTYPQTNGYIYSWTDQNGNSCGQTPATVNNNKPQAQMIFLPGNTTTWTGAVSTDWFDAGNWDTGVPTKRMHAIIPGTAPLMPTINTTGARTNNIQIDAGATLTLNGAGATEVSVYGNWTNNGTFVPGNGAVIFEGIVANQINCAATQTFYDLRINTANGAALTTGTYNLTGELQLNGGTFNTNNALTLVSNAVGTSRIDEINNLCAYTLDMFDSFGDGWNGAYINLYIDGVFETSYAASGTGSSETLYLPNGSSFDLEYVSGLYEWENTYTLSDPGGTGIFSDGPTPATGTVYSGTSSCTFVSTITGDVVAQRYIDAGATNWRFLTTPVTTGMTLGDWNDNFITSGFGGSDDPNFGWTSIYFYDETIGGDKNQGFVEATHVNNPIDVGEGVWVWCGDSLGGTNPFTIDLVNPANTGPINLPVSYTASGGATEDGWNMVGNPYFSTIDWDDADWVKTAINDAVYIWDPDLEQFASYIAGVGSNGGSRYIASSQAFWVQANGAGPVLTANEGVKAANDQGFKSNQTFNGVRIQIAGAGYQDETVIRAQTGATDNFDGGLDAYKVYSASYNNVPGIMSVMGNDVNYSINSIDEVTNDVVIPIRAYVLASGNYHLNFTLEGEIGSCLFIEDVVTGDMIDLYVDSTYSFNILDTTWAPRFYLHIGATPYSDIVNVSCNGAADGKVEVLGTGTGPWTYTLLDSSNNVLAVDSMSNSSALFNGLDVGVYTVLIEGNGGLCASRTIEVVMYDPAPVALSGTVQDEQMGNDGTIDLNIIGGTPPYNIAWSNGAITEDLFGLTPGVYDVTVTDNNGCQQTAQFIVGTHVGIDAAAQSVEMKVYPNPNNGSFMLELYGTLSDQNLQMEMVDQVGRIVHTTSLTMNTVNTIAIQGLKKGVYFIRIIGEHYRTVKPVIIQ